MQRFSKKRESILALLRSTKSHPGAEWIYSRLKPVYPDLSIATVYRNLNMLKNEGFIRSVGFVSGEERFDGFVSPHTHVICRKCGKIIDIDEIPVPEGLSDKVTSVTGFEISDASLTFSGICADCNKEKNN